MGVSENGGTPKSSILTEFSIINHPFWGTPIFGNIQINKHIVKRGEIVGPAILRVLETFFGMVSSWHFSKVKLVTSNVWGFKRSLGITLENEISLKMFIWCSKNMMNKSCVVLDVPICSYLDEQKKDPMTCGTRGEICFVSFHWFLVFGHFLKRLEKSTRIWENI